MQEIAISGAEASHTTTAQDWQSHPFFPDLLQVLRGIFRNDPAKCHRLAVLLLGLGAESFEALAAGGSPYLIEAGFPPFAAAYLVKESERRASAPSPPKQCEKRRGAPDRPSKRLKTSSPSEPKSSPGNESDFDLDHDLPAPCRPSYAEFSDPFQQPSNAPDLPLSTSYVLDTLSSLSTKTLKDWLSLLDCSVDDPSSDSKRLAEILFEASLTQGAKTLTTALSDRAFATDHHRTVLSGLFDSADPSYLDWFFSRVESVFVEIGTEEEFNKLVSDSAQQDLLLCTLYHIFTVHSFPILQDLYQENAQVSWFLDALNSQVGERVLQSSKVELSAAVCGTSPHRPTGPLGLGRPGQIPRSHVLEVIKREFVSNALASIFRPLFGFEVLQFSSSAKRHLPASVFPKDSSVPVVALRVLRELFSVRKDYIAAARHSLGNTTPGPDFVVDEFERLSSSPADSALLRIQYASISCSALELALFSLLPGSHVSARSCVSGVAGLLRSIARAPVNPVGVSSAAADSEVADSVVTASESESATSEPSESSSVSSKSGEQSSPFSSVSSEEEVAAGGTVSDISPASTSSADMPTLCTNGMKTAAHDLLFLSLFHAALARPNCIKRADSLPGWSDSRRIGNLVTWGVGELCLIPMKNFRNRVSNCSLRYEDTQLSRYSPYVVGKIVSSSSMKSDIAAIKGRQCTDSVDLAELQHGVIVSIFCNPDLLLDDGTVFPKTHIYCPVKNIADWIKHSSLDTYLTLSCKSSLLLPLPCVDYVDPSAMRKPGARYPAWNFPDITKLIALQVPKAAAGQWKIGHLCKPPLRSKSSVVKQPSHLMEEASGSKQWGMIALLVSFQKYKRTAVMKSKSREAPRRNLCTLWGVGQDSRIFYETCDLGELPQLNPRKMPVNMRI